MVRFTVLPLQVQETKAKLDSLSKMWTELKAMSDKIRRELQDALDMYNFQSAIDAIQSMVRGKLNVMASHVVRAF